MPRLGREWMPTGEKPGPKRTTKYTVYWAKRQWTEQDKLDRERCKTDLFFLAKEVLGYDLMTEGTHKQVTDFFVQKDPEKALKDQSEIKKRLLLFPRGAFKSSINIADVVQWILCFPDIRILVLTAGSGRSQSLSEAFVSEVTSFFTWNRLEKPGPLARLFPEFTIEPKDVKAGSYIAPNRKKQWKEPTVMANTIDSTLSGWHFEVIKCDDVVSNRNSQTLEALEKVTRNLHTNRKMLRLGFYYDLVGTRYNEYDAYGDAIRTNKGGMVTLHKPAMWIKDDPEKRVTVHDLKERPESDFEMLFPEELPYKKLMEEFAANEAVFFCQYMNDPIAAGAVIITPDDMRKATLPYDQLPALGDVHITWDLAYSTKKGRDYTAGIVARHGDGRILVIDAIRGRFTPKELAFNIVNTCIRHTVKTCAVEDSLGARFIEPEVQRIAMALGTEVYIEWITLEKDQHSKAKRYEATQPLVLDGRLQFSALCPHLDQIYEEMCYFNTVPHKDLADALSRQLRYLPLHYKSVEKIMVDTWEERKRMEYADIIYGRGKYAPKDEPAPSPNPYALEDILGGLIG